MPEVPTERPPETAEEWSAARAWWQLRLSDEQRARYDALRDLAPDPARGGSWPGSLTVPLRRLLAGLLARLARCSWPF